MAVGAGWVIRWTTSRADRRAEQAEARADKAEKKAEQSMAETRKVLERQIERLQSSRE